MRSRPPSRVPGGRAAAVGGREGGGHVARADAGRALTRRGDVGGAGSGPKAAGGAVESSRAPRKTAAAAAVAPGERGTVTSWVIDGTGSVPQASSTHTRAIAGTGVSKRAKRQPLEA